MEHAAAEHHGQLMSELGVWLFMIAILFGVQLFPQEVIATDIAYLIAGGILSFALFYYYIAWKFLKMQERQFLKDLMDLLFIGLIIFVAKDYGTFFFALLFVPIAAAAFALDLLHSLIIATSAALIIAVEIVLSGKGLVDEAHLILSGGQILIFVLVTMFVRFLALQVRHERSAKEAARARAAQLMHDLAEERKLEAMEREFINLTSHQLLTPISIIRGYASLLGEFPNDLNKKQREFVGEISENSRRLVRLIDDLRLDAKINQNRYHIDPRSSDLRTLIEDLLREFRVQFRERRRRLISHLPKTRLPAVFDADATRQVLWNILENALLYTPKGGLVELSAHRREHMVEIAIKDSGIGIPASEQTKITQRFYRASNSLGVFREGSGLGLTIAKSLIERQHGRLHFVSEENKGSTFTVQLPSSR